MFVHFINNRQIIPKIYNIILANTNAFLRKMLIAKIPQTLWKTQLIEEIIRGRFIISWIRIKALESR